MSEYEITVSGVKPERYIFDAIQEAIVNKSSRKEKNMAGYTHEQITKAKEIFERAFASKWNEDVDPSKSVSMRAILYAMGVTEIVPVVDNNFIIVRKNYRVENYDTLVDARLDSCSDDKARVIIQTGKFDF